MAYLYALGSNGSGQLGIGHEEDVSVPKPVQFFEGSRPVPGPVTIRAGGNHTLLLSLDGELFSAGEWESGARGVRPSEAATSNTFSRVDFGANVNTTNRKVEFCVATWTASVVVMRNLEDKSQQIYTFGTGEKGELGAGNLIFASFKALPLADFPPTGTAIVDLAASMGHVVAVLDNGDVYGWGNSRQGQLGEPHDIVYSPRKFQNVKFSATRAICGKDFSVLVGATPSDYAFFGRDKWNSEPVVKSQLTKCQSLSAGWGNLIALDDDGKLHASGRNDHGQLPGPDMPKLTQVAVGSEHTVALTESGDVLAWGWGEHGNCGPTTENGDVIGRWNTIASSKNLPPGAKFVAVGAGCATSFICIRTAA